MHISPYWSKRHFVLPVIAMLFISSCHVPRYFFWNFADIRDNRKFHALPVENGSDRDFYFIEGKEGKVKLPDTVLVDGKPCSWDEAMVRSKTVAFLFIRNDSLLAESYYRGYNESSVVPSFSMSKSFVSALTGIAIQEGFIKSVDDKVKDYVPELPAGLFPELTIEDLLDMRSGIEFNEAYLNPFADVGKFYYGRNLGKYVGKLRPAHVPGTNFHYKSVDSQLLGMAVENATGMGLTQYLQEKIWIPLGMESPASWSIDSKRHGEVKAFCCLNAIARDYARFGRLYLNNGNWQGKQIVPEGWVKRSVSFTEPKNNLLYSYNWWHNRRYEIFNDTVDYGGVYVEHSALSENDMPVKLIIRPVDDFFASGLLGQYIYVYPGKSIIIVRLGKKEGGIRWESLFSQLVKMN